MIKYFDIQADEMLPQVKIQILTAWERESDKAVNDSLKYSTSLHPTIILDTVLDFGRPPNPEKFDLVS